MYCITTPNTSGPGIFFGKGVSLTPNGAGSWTFTCTGCTGSESYSGTFKGPTFTGTSTIPGTPGHDDITMTLASAPAVQPSLSVRVGVAKPAVAVGNELGVSVTVSAGSEAVSGIRFAKGLQASGGAVVSRSPSDLGGFALDAGASRTFSFTVKGTTAGVATLSAQASGTADSGSPVSGNSSFSLQVISPKLAVLVSATPTDVALKQVPDKVTDPGGERVTVTVRVKNTGASTVDHVSLVNRLVIGFDDSDPVVAVIPLRQQGTLRPPAIWAASPLGLSRSP